MPQYAFAVPTADPHHSSMHAAVSYALAALDDAELRALLADADRLGSGIGGDTLRISVDRHPVFVKRIPLTDIEREPARHRSTANTFGLPPYFHYGIGSAGFGAWRELATHELTTAWALDETAPFPLTYHWRIVPTEPIALPDELRDVDAAVDYWEGSDAILRRIEALRSATASVIVFLEYVPLTLEAWLTAQLERGPSAFADACELVERELHAIADVLTAHDLLHLDAHFENLLTDGTRLYAADFGLAISETFHLDPAERAFVDKHRAYDRSYMFAQLSGFLRSARERTGTLHPVAERIAMTYEPVDAAVRPFYRALRTVSRHTPYPVEAEHAAWQHLTPRR